jgi:hypothetical protein
VLHFEPRALSQGDAATVALEHEREQATKVAPFPGVVQGAIKLPFK